MNTKNLPLKNMAKTVMIVMLLGVTGMTKVAKAQSTWEQSQNYLFYLVYADYQTCEHLMPEREQPSIPDAIRRNLLPVDEGSMLNWIWEDEPNPEARRSGLIGLAKNEKEGFQVFFREQEKERNLRIVVDTFRNSQNEVLQHKVYLEEFFWPEGIWEENSPNADSLAEALVLYSSNQVKQTSVGHNVVFYVELQSMKNQTPGEYVSTITAYDGDEVIDTRTITAKVWNFELPENHYSEVVMGLYNCNSGYKSTSSFLTLNGIQVDNNGNVAPENLEEAKRILNGYQDCLLEHGVSTYELPRWLMDDDPKAAELTMADPRRKVFTVPVLYGDLNNSGSGFKPEAQQVLQQYKDIVYDNPFLKDKAFFYPYDEPENATDFACIDQFCNVISNYWPGYHATVPFYSDYDTTIAHFEGKIDILCPHKDMFDPYDPENPNIDFTHYENWLQDYMTRDHTWRYYPGGKQNGGIECFIHAIATVGTMRRVVFWQQYIINSDGILIWNCAYLPDNWVKKTLPASSSIQKGNGDGLLLYPGTMFGQDAAKPVVSLRLKQLSEGIDDYDYLCLAKDFIGPDYVTNILQSGVTPSEALAVFYHYTQLDYLCKIFNRQYDYDAWSCRFMNITRHYIGNALDAANTEHTWGEWQTAVLPDETHDVGLEIRTCSHCGAQESREKTFLYRFLGTEDNQWSNLSNWEYQPESLPVLGEAVIIASDCEVDSSQTVSSVTVKNGCNLTIKEGATLTSRLVSTEENAQIIIEDGGQLVHNSEGVMATVKKNVPGHETDGGYVFISSPVAGDTDPSQVVGLLTGDYDFYRFDAAASDGLEWRNYRISTFDMTNGTGYLYANPDEVELNFTGTVKASNTPEIKMPSFAEGYFFDGWNLMGNPFTCNAYLNSDAEGMAFYRMNANGDGYEAATDAIHPMEGFFVQATAANQTFTIGREQPEGTRNELHLQIVQNTDNRKTQHAIDNVIIRFGKGNTLEKLSFREHNAKLYIPQDDKNYAVVNADRQGELPLSFKVAKDGTYMLSFSTEGVDFSYLHLIDNQTGTDVDLLQTLNYSFDAKVMDNENRFKVVYSINSTK